MWCTNSFLLCCWFYKSPYKLHELNLKTGIHYDKTNFHLYTSPLIRISTMNMHFFPCAPTSSSLFGKTPSLWGVRTSHSVKRSFFLSRPTTFPCSGHHVLHLHTHIRASPWGSLLRFNLPRIKISSLSCCFHNNVCNPWEAEGGVMRCHDPVAGYSTLWPPKLIKTQGHKENKDPH